MSRPTMAELERRCQKPDHRTVGNWMARRISRPLALRVTWVVAGWGISAHAATCLAWLVGLAAAAALSTGQIGGWLAAAALLQLWYLLDHVDGQLARYHGTASLDGVQLDYLMHHTLNMLIPLAAGHGLSLAAGQFGPWQPWLLAGLAWGVALLCLGLLHDTRYKAFVQRLKRVRGLLEVTGGGAARPAAPPPIPRHALRLAAWLARKSCEIHVVLNVLTGIALGQWLLADRGLAIGRVGVAVLSSAACVVTVVSLVRSLRRGAAEREFALWYRPPAGSLLTFQDGWWRVDGPQRHRQFAQEAPETD